MRIVENLADSIDWATWYTGCSQLWKPLVCLAVKKLFLQGRHKFLTVTNSLWIGSETGVLRQVFAPQKVTERLVEAVIAT